MQLKNLSQYGKIKPKGITASKDRRESAMETAKLRNLIKLALLFAICMVLSLALAACSFGASGGKDDTEGENDTAGGKDSDKTENGSEDGDQSDDSQGGSSAEGGEDEGSSADGSDDSENGDSACAEHSDADLNGYCDECKARVEVVYDGTLTLIKDGKPTFGIVIGTGVGVNYSAAVRLADAINSRISSGKVVAANQNKAVEKPIEILIGTVTERGERYNIDMYSLGYEGYIIEIVDSKLIVLGGSEDALTAAMTDLCEKVFGITDPEKTEKIENLKITESIDKRQRDFEAKSFTVAGKPIESYSIAANAADSYAYEAAKEARELIYRKTGKRLAIKSLGDVADEGSYISFAVVENGGENSTPEGFCAAVTEEGNLIIECEFPDKFDDCVAEVWDSIFANSEISLAAGWQFKKNIRTVYYSEFGAVGDGVADDYTALRNTHDYANRWGHKVSAEPGKTYRIAYAPSSITVRTDTDFCGSTILIDDTGIAWNDKTSRSVWVFNIASSSYLNGASVTVPTGMTVSRGQTNIGMTFDEPCMLKLESSSEKIFIRYGNNANSGNNKQEYILVNEAGDVDPSTPIMYDYATITSIVRYKINDDPISIGNGTVITVAPDPKAQNPEYDNNYCYFNRGFYIGRSNTTLYNITHKVEGEDMTVEQDRNGDGVVDLYGDDKSYGVPYKGTFNFNYCYNVRFIDSVVEGHQAYSFWQNNGASTSRNEMGSYAITANYCIGLVFEGISQYENAESGEVITNRKMYHGVMSSNFCRNFTVTDCYLDRFDAHTGLYNATLTDSTFGFGILVIGAGELYIENVVRPSGDFFIHLRNDYNSTFDGKITIKNCEAGSSVKCVLMGIWNRHYSGLPNRTVRELEIDGLIAESGSLCLFNIKNAAPSALADEVNPLYLPDSVKARRVLCADGVTPLIPTLSKYSDVFAEIDADIE